jgi:hypothetical protein
MMLTLVVDVEGVEDEYGDYVKGELAAYLENTINDTSGMRFEGVYWTASAEWEGEPEYAPTPLREALDRAMSALAVDRVTLRRDIPDRDGQLVTASIEYVPQEFVAKVCRVAGEG